MSVKKIAVLEEFTWQLPVKDKDLSTPPGSPAKGDRYIVAATGSGLWTGHTGDIALCTVGGGSPSWEFVTKIEGMITWIEDENLFYLYDGSNWVNFNHKITYSKSFIITNPTSASDGAIWRVPYAITITAIHGVQVGGTNVIGMLTECDSDGLNPVDVNSSDITILATNVNMTSLSNSSIDAGDYIGWKTTSVSGAVTKAIITFDYTIN